MYEVVQEKGRIENKMKAQGTQFLNIHWEMKIDTISLQEKYKMPHY